MSDKSEPEQFRKLFIGGLSYDSTEESLKAHFEQWGEIVDCVVMREGKNQSRKSRGFGFITFKRAHMVDDAQAARPHKIDGREIQPKRAVPREDSGKPEAQVTVNKIYVSGLRDEIGEDDLREYFGPYGNIVSVNVVVDKATGKQRGFAFVEFDDYDPVDKIVLERHNCKGKRLEVKKALSRDEMEKIKMKKEMGGYGGRGGGGGGRGEWRTADEFDRYGGGGGGYNGNYGESYGSGGGYNGNYGGGYGSGGWDDYNGGGGGGYSNSGGWGGDFGGSYGGGPMRGGGGYSQRSPGPYGGGGRGGGRGSGGRGGGSRRSRGRR